MSRFESTPLSSGKGLAAIGVLVASAFLVASYTDDKDLRTPSHHSAQTSRQLDPCPKIENYNSTVAVPCSREVR